MSKPKTRWADESADMSPDFRPAVAPLITPGETIYLEEEEIPTPSKKTTSSRRQPAAAPRPRTRTLYVGNLAFNVNEDELGSFLVSGGCFCTDIRIASERSTGRSRGYAFADAKDDESFQKGLTLNGKELSGMKLEIVDDKTRTTKAGERSKAEPAARRSPRPEPVPEFAARRMQSEAVSMAEKQRPKVEDKVEVERVAKAKPRSERRMRPAREAPKVVAPVETDDFVVLKKKQTKAKAPEVAEAPKVAAGGLKNRFAGLVETDSDH